MCVHMCLHVLCTGMYACVLNEKLRKTEKQNRRASKTLRLSTVLTSASRFLNLVKNNPQQDPIGTSPHQVLNRP